MNFQFKLGEFIFTRLYKKTMKKIVLIFSILTVMISGCNDGSTKDDYNSGECYLNTNAQAIVHDGITREYILYVPN